MREIAFLKPKRKKRVRKTGFGWNIKYNINIGCKGIENNLDRFH